MHNFCEIYDHWIDVGVVDERRSTIAATIDGMR